MGFDRQAAVFHKLDASIVIIDNKINLFGAEDGFIVRDILVSHGDVVAFVADTSKAMWANIENSALHQDFGPDELSTGLLQFLTQIVFVDV